MLYLQRSVVPENLIGHQTVVRFTFTDIADMSDWWLLVVDEDVEICVSDPGKDVDVYLTTSVRTMAGIWMGDTTYRKAIASGDLKVDGLRALTRNIPAWLGNSIFADIPSASEI
ncbi:SCP2 sterol-binding domain-containing protein [Synechococcus sp. CCY 9618]|uniref:SCP2 sterol-binding domain-containing protein n=1 Tax=Synechococcus sp. CCY 9618 TaxID=2815602 RepID=UPI001C233068|nr:SCP2 sterol-binding domain-containing protein [Synechococcus sp. CCY 9618]